MVSQGERNSQLNPHSASNNSEYVRVKASTPRNVARAESNNSLKNLSTMSTSIRPGWVWSLANLLFYNIAQCNRSTPGSKLGGLGANPSGLIIEQKMNSSTMSRRSIRQRLQYMKALFVNWRQILFYERIIDMSFCWF